ncbi:lateral flagellin LafA [Zobellella iuensis]|uniref:Flagellin n=1 Tax=Zobellella iuensis TaxID=2803811 RepID=A0ABS1QVR5_9GAMM|nr:lateral flagellin LafA [Zobellella iuensis]MBL1378846.1 lateral flagellin LafA [Zobellella iuensis]
MGLSIHTNYTSLVTQNTLNSTNKMLGNAMERLGTGFRINSAADDAAGLQIATRLQAQSNGMSVAMRNSQDAISMLQTGEGAMDEVTNIMHRMKDLATQAANDTNSDDDRTAMQTEYDELGNELTNIITNTKYAGDDLFAAGGKFTAAASFQIGASSAETLSFNASVNLAAVTAAITTIKAETLDDAANAGSAIDELETALNDVGTLRAQFGANINRLEHTINNLSNMRENTESAKGRIMDADFAQEASNMTKNQMLMQSGMSVLSNANQMSGLVMSLLR